MKNSDRAAEMLTRKVTALLMCLGLAFAIYWPCLHGEMIWDDHFLVGANPFFRSPVFIGEVFRHWLFTDSFSTYYRPVQNLSYIADYWIWRGELVGYHFTNILLHGSTGFLLCLLLRQLLCGVVPEQRKREVVSLLVAVVWTVHPIHNAAVAYISGRADSLASLLAIAAWLAVLQSARAVNCGRAAGLGIAAILYLGALASKEIALVWGALFVMDTLFLQKALPGWTRFVRVAGVGAIVAVYGLLRGLPELRPVMEGGMAAPIGDRFLIMLRALGDYVGLIVFPGRLTMERSLGDGFGLMSARAWRDSVGYEYLAVVGMLSLFAVLWLCRTQRPGHSLRVVGAIWFAVAFLPISNLFPLNAQVAEHWIYVASVGGLLFLGGLLLALPHRFQAWVVIAVLVGCVPLGVRTWLRAGEWRTAEGFYASTIRSGGATPRILMTLASHYALRGDVARQERVLRQLLDRHPDFTPARIALGRCLQHQRRDEEAAAFLQIENEASEARRFAATWPAALYLARMESAVGRATHAKAILDEALNRFPEAWELVKARAQLALDAGGSSEACAIAERYAGSHWWHLDAWMTVGLFRALKGDDAAASAAFRHASRLDYYDPRPMTELARVEARKGERNAAIEAQCAAINRQPGQPSAYLGLAAIFESFGEKRSAEAAYRRAQVIAATRL